MAQYFNLTLDTTAPSSGSITANSYYNAPGNVTISANNATYMCVWTNQTASADMPTGKNLTWIPYNTTAQVSFSNQGINYVHAVFMDEVGNVSSVVNSNATIYDSVAPIISVGNGVSINHNDSYTNNTSVTVRVSVTDATSGVDYVILSGDIVETGNNAKFTFNDTDRTNGYKDCSVTLTSGDGTKTISATVTDIAGNSTSGVSDTIVLDTTDAEATLILRDRADTNNLPTYINDGRFCIVIETEDTDITGYKVWGDSAEVTSEWAIDQNGKPTTYRIPVFTDGRMVLGPYDFDSGEGSKTIHAEIKDAGGNVTALTDYTVILDTTDPVVTLSASPAVISAQHVLNADTNKYYDEVTFTCGATDANPLTNYRLKLGNTVIKQGTFTNNMTVVVTESEIVAISANQGDKSFTLEVDDAAGNTGTSSIVTVAVDLTAPTGSVEADPYYTTTTINVTVAGSDSGGAVLSKMKVWIDNAEPNEWSTFAAGSKSFEGIAEGQHTAHLKLQDSVGNISSPYNSSSFIVDTTAPTGNLSTVTYTNTRTINVTVSASDDKSGIVTSGLYQMKFWGNIVDGNNAAITENAASWETYTNTKSVTLATGDGSKTIYAKFKDNAGNVTATAVTCTTILDTDEPDVTLVLTKTDNSTTLPAHVNYRNFSARVGFTNETQDSPIVYYKLVGDFTDSSDEWIAYTADSGKSYMTISNLQFTTGDGNKTVTAYLKDAAGNISATSASVTTVYDSSAPVIDITTIPDYNKVSKVHELRRDANAATISGKYCDTCIFGWSANEALQAFKVCVNQPEQTAASAVAIGTTNGSQNMSGGAVSANTEVTSVIMGADFAATSAVDDTDGAYEIIVYGQDQGGTWSAIHVIS